jgi:hypothetical protein
MSKFGFKKNAEQPPVVGKGADAGLHNASNLYEALIDNYDNVNESRGGKHLQKMPENFADFSAIVGQVSMINESRYNRIKLLGQDGDQAIQRLGIAAPLFIPKAILDANSSVSGR